MRGGQIRSHSNSVRKPLQPSCALRLSSLLSPPPSTTSHPLSSLKMTSLSSDGIGIANLPNQVRSRCLLACVSEWGRADMHLGL
jgi:hypothetical protein